MSTRYRMMRVGFVGPYRNRYYRTETDAGVAKMHAMAMVAGRLMVNFAHGMSRCVQPTHMVNLGTQVLCGCDRRASGCPIRRQIRADSEPDAALIRAG